MREFLMRVSLWREDITFDAEEDEDEYTLDTSGIGDDLAVHDVLKLTYDENELDEAYYRHDSYKLILDSEITPSEDETDAFVATCHIVPTISCVLYPDYIFTRYTEAVAGLAGMLLAGQEGKPWHSQAQAKQFQLDYRRGLQRAMMALEEEETISG